MPTQRELVCCHKMEHIKCLVENPHLEIYPSCIIQHADFNHVCLCRTVLTVSLHPHLHHYESVDDENRYIANHAIHLFYLMLFTLRKFQYLTWWGWQYLGKH